MIGQVGLTRESSSTSEGSCPLMMDTRHRALESVTLVIGHCVRHISQSRAIICGRLLCISGLYGGAFIHTSEDDDVFSLSVVKFECWYRLFLCSLVFSIRVDH